MNYKLRCSGTSKKNVVLIQMLWVCGDGLLWFCFHVNRRGGHAVLDDGLDLGYVEDGTPCGPNMMCLDHRCIPVTTFNLSTCPGSSYSRICSHHGVSCHCHLHQGLWLHSATNINTCALLTQQTCNNEMKCICDPDYTGKDCSVFDPIPIPTPSEGPEKYRGKHTRQVRQWE